METTNKGILKVSGRIVRSLAVTFFYDDSTTMSITICEGDLVTAQYVKDCKLVEATGKVLSIEYVSGSRTLNGVGYNTIKIDCSSEYSSDVRTIALHDIRNLDFVREEDNIEHPVEDEEKVPNLDDIDPGFNITPLE